MGLCAALLVAPLAPAVTSGCGGADHPPLLQDFERDGAAGGDDASVFADSDPGKPRCQYDFDGGPCGCLEMSFLSDVPNIYFVLDRSASMQVDDKWQTIRIATALTITKLGPRANFGAAIFPGVNVGDGCGVGNEVMPPVQGDAPAGTAGPTTTRFTTATNVQSIGGTPTAASLRALASRLSGLPGRTFVVLATDGGPNCDFDTTCTADGCIPNIEHTDPQCAPGGPTNCCSPSLYGPTQCLDAQPTLDAVTALAAAGIRTFVIGVPGSGPYAALLDAVAEAGGTARATSPKYYRVDSSDSAAFAGAIADVAAKITATCTLTLSPPPADPGKVNVYFDDVVVPPDPADGWTFDGTTVTLVGDACARVTSGQVLNLRVIGGCPTVPPK